MASYMDILQAIKRNGACDFESKDQEKVMKHFRDKRNQVKARAKELDKKFGGGGRVA